MGVIIRPQYDDVYDLSIDAADMAVMAYNQYPALYPQFVEVVPASGKEQKGSELDGWDTMDELSENEEYGKKKPVQGYDYTYQTVTYGNQYEISWVAWDDDPKGVIGSTTTAVSGFGRAAQKRLVSITANILNNGFSSVTSPDGQALFDDSHPKSPSETGTTYDNKITTALDANGSALNTAYVAFTNNQFTMAGHQIDVPQMLLVHPPALHENAYKSCKAVYGDGTTTAPTTAAAGDLFGDRPVEPLTLPELSAANGGSDTAWFLIPRVGQLDVHPLRLWMVKDFSVDPAVRDQNTKSYKINADMRAVVGVRSWRGTLGSTGAG